jgi:hypothetical protein
LNGHGAGNNAGHSIAIAISMMKAPLIGRAGA